MLSPGYAAGGIQKNLLPETIAISFWSRAYVCIFQFFNISLDLDIDWLKFIVAEVKKIQPVDTIDRCSIVYDAIINNQDINCFDLDVIEQAWIEVQLEKKYDFLIFPYGTSWFKTTGQINEFIATYPSYLKHINPRLPCYNNIKNPYYLKGKI